MGLLVDGLGAAAELPVFVSFVLNCKKGPCRVVPGLFYGTFGRDPYVAPRDTLRLPADKKTPSDDHNKSVNSVLSGSVQGIVREAAGFLPGACRRLTNKGDKTPLKETLNCDHNNRCPTGSRAWREPAGVTSPTGTGAIGTEALAARCVIGGARNVREVRSPSRLGIQPTVLYAWNHAHGGVTTPHLGHCRLAESALGCGNFAILQITGSDQAIYNGHLSGSYRKYHMPQSVSTCKLIRTTTLFVVIRKSHVAKYSYT
ncbi:hypothetical protein Bbelb_024580 [Branchiostoma belcheri]|nr:hypothetical protein Bbelb_024580 [Branchiostoma belcheri]